MDDLTLPLEWLSLPYLLVLLLILAYWLWRVATQARRAQAPRVAWWTLPGLLLLLLAPLLEVPALYGLGAGLLLLAEFWPGAYRPGSRPALPWPLFGLALGLFLIAQAFMMGPRDTLSLPALVGLGLGSAGLAALVAHLSWAATPAPRRNSFDTRWSVWTEPEWPDLSVTLTGSGAVLHNQSRRALELAGWSPVSINGWLRVRGEDGQVLNTLPAGQTAFLPLDAREGGVRVWYTLAGQSAPLLFRADWVPASHQPANRVVN